MVQDMHAALAFARRLASGAIGSRGVCAALLCLLAVGLGPVAAQAPTDADRQQRRLVLRFLTSDDFPPFNFKDEDGQLTGFNVDLARAICLQMNVPCTVNERPWPDLLTALARRQADAVIAGHIVTAQALATVDFSDRYFHNPGRFAGRRDAPRLEYTPDGLDGYRIGVARGTTHEAYLQAFFRNSTLERFDTPELARDALMAGKVDAIFDDGVSLSMWINGTLSRECCEFKGGPFMEPKFFGDGMAIALTKNDRQLRDELNNALRKLRANGRFEELVLRYFPNRVF
jgi:polar amino acid transport system substrate-binding protein